MFWMSPENQLNLPTVYQMNSKLQIFCEGSNKEFAMRKCIGKTAFPTNGCCFLWVDSKNKGEWKEVSNGLNHPLKEERASVRAPSLRAKYTQSDAANPEGRQLVDNILRERWACSVSSSATELTLIGCESFGRNNLVLNKMNFIPAWLLRCFLYDRIGFS